MPQVNVTVYGSLGCPDTVRSMGVLDAKNVPYEFKDVDESPELNAYIADLNGGKRVMPTIRIDNENYFNPGEDALLSAVIAAGGD